MATKLKLKNLFSENIKKYKAVEKPDTSLNVYGILFELSACHSLTLEEIHSCLSKVQEHYMDFNEFRVSEIDDIADDFKMANRNDDIMPIIDCLDLVFDKNGTIDLSDIANYDDAKISDLFNRLTGNINGSCYSYYLNRLGKEGPFVLSDNQVRILKRLKLVDENDDIEVVRKKVEKAFPAEKGVSFFLACQVHANEYCREDNPSCSRCPFLKECEFGQNIVKEREEKEKEREESKRKALEEEQRKIENEKKKTSKPTKKKKEKEEEELVAVASDVAENATSKKKKKKDVEEQVSAIEVADTDDKASKKKKKKEQESFVAEVVPEISMPEVGKKKSKKGANENIPEPVLASDKKGSKKTAEIIANNDKTEKVVSVKGKKNIEKAEVLQTSVSNKKGKLVETKAEQKVKPVIAEKKQSKPSKVEIVKKQTKAPIKEAKMSKNAVTKSKPPVAVKKNTPAKGKKVKVEVKKPVKKSMPIKPKKKEVSKKISKPVKAKKPQPKKNDKKGGKKKK